MILRIFQLNEIHKPSSVFRFVKKKWEKISHYANVIQDKRTLEKIWRKMLSITFLLFNICILFIAFMTLMYVKHTITTLHNTYLCGVAKWLGLLLKMQSSTSALRCKYSDVVVVQQQIHFIPLASEMN